ncbi:hypothetical protein [Estrella lausannensis]|uniref:Uncharacterized protein n=1 Tax=Estrella lausannensis TaxID=483423 RepID=A0A0H5DTC5_9BACT|nr:hypothetical protein [Estrella lausannensis]CRX39074.1 hypothetical protein ELAC_1747 [Estrella lausannensis]
MIGGVPSLEYLCRLTIAREVIETNRTRPLIISGEKEHMDIYEVALQRFFPHKSYIRISEGTIVI